MQQYQEHLSTSLPQIPDDVARMAHEQQLGASQASSMISELRKGWRWANAMFAGAALSYLVWFLLFSFRIDFFLRNTSFLIFIIPPIIIAVFLLTGALSMANTRRACTLYPCDGGLIFRQSSKQFRVIRWEEIETIQQTVSRFFFMGIRKSDLYAIRCHDGGTLTFSGHPRFVKNLASVFEDQFTRRRLPFQLADYQAGQTLHFGLLRVDRNGVGVGEQTLLWEQVADMSLLKGRKLVIYKTGKRQEIWLSLPAFKIGNLSILLALFKRIRSGQTEQEAGLQAITATYGGGTTIVSSRRNTIDPLPDDLAVLADAHQLGERRLDQQLGRSLLTSWARIITLSIIGGILLVGSAVFVFASLSNESFRRGSSPFITFVSYGILFALIMISAAIQSLLQIHNHTYTFERGLILKFSKQAPAAVRWEEIEIVWRRSPIRLTRHSQSTALSSASGYMLQLRDGSKYTLHRLNMRMDTLSKLIREQVVPLQLPAAIDAYQTGQTLTFGEVQVSQQGFAVGERLLPWSQVKSVGLRENKLVVFDLSQRKPWCRVTAKGIPNLFLLFELADYARNGALRAE